MILQSTIHDGQCFTLEHVQEPEQRLDHYVIRDQFGALYAWTTRAPAEHHWNTLFHKAETPPRFPRFDSTADRNAAILGLVLDGLSYGQIGLKLGISESVVSGVVFRARALAHREAA